MGTELVIRIDLADMLKGLPEQQKDGEAKPLPEGYRCQTCWRDDGQHEDSCEFKHVTKNGADSHP